MAKTKVANFYRFEKHVFFSPFIIKKKTLKEKKKNSKFVTHVVQVEILKESPPNNKHYLKYKIVIYSQIIIISQNHQVLTIIIYHQNHQKNTQSAYYCPHFDNIEMIYYFVSPFGQQKSSKCILSKNILYAPPKYMAN